MDARGAVLEYNGAVVGVLTRECGRLRGGRPTGRRLSDHHGPLVREGLPLDSAALLRACGVVARRFEGHVGGFAYTGAFERFDDDAFRAIDSQLDANLMKASRRLCR